MSDIHPEAPSSQPAAAVLAPEPPGDTTSHTISASVILYALMAFACVGIALMAGWWLLIVPQMGVTQSNQAYFIVLIIMGLAVSLFLFGTLRSIAALRGNSLGFALEFGGPAAMFMAITFGGFHATKPFETFNFTVRLNYVGPQSDRSAYQTALNRAKIDISVGGNTISYDVPPNGTISILDVPARLRNGRFTVSLNSDHITLTSNERTFSIPAQDEQAKLDVTLSARPFTSLRVGELTLLNEDHIDRSTPAMTLPRYETRTSNHMTVNNVSDFVVAGAFVVRGLPSACDRRQSISFDIIGLGIEPGRPAFQYPASYSSTLPRRPDLERLFQLQPCEALPIAFVLGCFTPRRIAEWSGQLQIVVSYAEEPNLTERRPYPLPEPFSVLLEKPTNLAALPDRLECR